MVERPNSPYITPPNNCVLGACRSNQVPSLNCRCSHPYVGTIHFFSYSFSNLENVSYFSSLQGSLMSVFLSNGLPVDSISLSNATIDVYSYLSFRLQIFPSGQDIFNRTSVGTIGSLLNRQLFPLQHYGPFYFLDESYCCFAGTKYFNLILGEEFWFMTVDRMYTLNYAPIHFLLSTSMWNLRMHT